KEKIQPEIFAPSGERGVAVITAMLNDKKAPIESGVVYNRGAIPNLPDDLAVEVPVSVDAQGVHPVCLGPLPDGIAKLLHMQASCQQLSVDAAVDGSKELALQALLIDPVINSSLAAEKILNELWEWNKPFIRPCL
ncbi:MAG: alpha-glucosidase/alpha-galactosidase, partial [Chloroflexi bacterium]